MEVLISDWLSVTKMFLQIQQKRGCSMRGSMRAVNAAFFGALFALTMPAASAQELSGIKVLKLVTEHLDDDARYCGVSEDGIEAASRIALSNSKLAIRNEPGPYYYVQVGVIKAGMQCAGSINVSVRRIV